MVQLSTLLHRHWTLKLHTPKISNAEWRRIYTLGSHDAHADHVILLTHCIQEKNNHSKCGHNFAICCYFVTLRRNYCLMCLLLRLIPNTYISLRSCNNRFEVRWQILFHPLSSAVHLRVISGHHHMTLLCYWRLRNGYCYFSHVRTFWLIDWFNSERIINIGSHLPTLSQNIVPVFFWLTVYIISALLLSYFMPVRGSFKKFIA